MIRAANGGMASLTAMPCRVKTHDEPFVSYVKDVLSNYGMSVKYGHHHIYQALPRLLTVYFDFGTYCVGITKQTKEASLPL